MWLIQPDALHALEQARQSYTPADAEARMPMRDERPGYERILVKDKDSRTATINISGVLTKTPDIIAMIFGGGNTVYSDIQEAIRMADEDDGMDAIQLAIDSPGGAVDGLFDAAAAVVSAETPTRAVVSGKAASAGYIVAAACDEVVAANPTSSVGSFGVAVDAVVREGVVTITNTESPDKRPDMETEEGQAVVRDHLDSLHAIFADIVGEGRGVDPSLVTERFGSGRMFAASEAMKRGMIDRIERDAIERPAGTTPTEGGQATTHTTEKVMDLDKLKAEHPDVYRAAVDHGVAQERDRVSAHLIMGQSSGDMETATKAIEDGSQMTASLSAKYQAAGMRRNAMEDRGAESAESEGAAEAGAAQGGEEQTSEEAHAEAVAALVANQEVI